MDTIAEIEGEMMLSKFENLEKLAAEEEETYQGKEKNLADFVDI